MYHTDPLCHCRVRCVRLWPWVLSGLIVAGGLWLYLTPIPSRPTVELIITGPDSPLYGPMKGAKL